MELYSNHRLIRYGALLTETHTLEAGQLLSSFQPVKETQFMGLHSFSAYAKAMGSKTVKVPKFFQYNFQLVKITIIIATIAYNFLSYHCRVKLTS